MAISASSVFEIRSSATAGNVNGGFFVTGSSGTDFSQQDSAAYNLTGVTSAGAGNTVLTANAAADMVGNGAYVVSGTNFTSTVAGGANRFEVVSVVVGVSITFSTNVAGTSICSGIGSNGVINIGGALSLGSSDDAVFEAAVAGVKYWIKAGTYTQNGNVAITASGTTQKPIVVEGYNATRGDAPTGTNRPIINQGAVATNWGVNWDVYNIRFTGTTSGVVLVSAGGKIVNCHVLNTSTTAGRVALTMSADCLADNCELISYRGIAIQSGAGLIHGCYIHDSNVGIQNTTTGNPMIVTDTIIANCVTQAINFSAANTARNLIKNCTLYGAENKLGTGINLASGNTDIAVMNTIIAGFVTGITHADTQTVSYDLCNDFYNNTTNATNWALGVGTITTNPAFTSVSQVTGTTATTSGNDITDSGKNFTTAGVVAGRDFVHIVSGTGITAGIYGISSVGTTTLTLDIAPGTSATADKVYQITTGRNFAVGTNMKAVASPSGFPGGYTTSYVDIGAAQRIEPTGGSGTFGSSYGG